MMIPKTSALRKYERFRGRFAVTFAYFGSTRKGTALNFSESGLFIQAETLPESGSTIELTCSFGKMGELKLVGKVVWIREGHFVSSSENEPRGFGFELVTKPREYSEFVEKFKNYLKAQESRQNDRLIVKHKVSYASGYQFLTDYCENLSRGGLFLSTQEALAQGQILTITLDVPGIEQPITVEGKVMYRLSDEEGAPAKAKKGVGIQFINLSDDTVSKLQGLIKRLKFHRLSKNRHTVNQVPAAGSITDFLVPEILLNLFQRQFSGKLILKLQGYSKAVYLKGGRPFFVESNLRDETLGRYLVKMGIIENSTFIDFSKELIHSDFKFGELLLKHQILDASTLSQLLLSHQEEKLSHTLQYFDGSYEISEQTEWPAGLSFFPLRLFHVLFSGAQYWYDEALVQAWCGIDQGNILKLKGALPQAVELPPYCLRMLGILKVPQTILELSQSLKMPSEQLYPMLFIAQLAGWIEQGSHAEKLSARDIPPTPMTPSELSELEKKINQDYIKVTTMDFFQIFDLTPADSIYGVDIRYFKWIESYKNETLLKIKDTKLLEKASFVTSTIKIAYETIKDSFLRQIYIRRHAVKINRELRKDYFQTDLIYIRSIQLLEQKKVDEMLALLEKNSSLLDKDASLTGVYAWGLFLKNSQTNHQSSLDLLHASISKSPADAQLRYFRGKVLEFSGADADALLDMQKAIALQPGFMKAEATRDFLLQKQSLLKKGKK